MSSVNICTSEETLDAVPTIPGTQVAGLQVAPFSHCTATTCGVLPLVVCTV